VTGGRPDGVTSKRRLLGRISIGVYRQFRRGYAKLFSLAVSGAFASFGTNSVVEPPFRIEGEKWISLGSGVFIGTGSWLQAIPEAETDEIVLRIGDGVSIVGSCVISGVRSVTIGDRALFARNVYIADHSHAFGDARTAIRDQGVDRVAAVEIGAGAWLGENVVIGPGVRVGTGSVVGANAVVLSDVPDRSVAVGAPARIVHRL
jgi:lipopolysaccharide O-acetyltransferase